MKTLLIFLFAFCTISGAIASRTQPYEECFFTEEEGSDEISPRTIPRRSLHHTGLPEITFESIKEQQLLNKLWGPCRVPYNYVWHLHWAVENRRDIEEAFPASSYTYKIQPIDDSGLFNLGSGDSRFVTYLLTPITLEGKEIETPIYTFFLSLPKYCKMNHSQL